MAGLTWLHLSDWHQKDENFDRKVVRDALIKDIEERAKIHPDLRKVDFIIFSGDAAFSGKEAEYKAAETHLFEPALEAAGLDKNRLFIVPGNHDLDRDDFKYLPGELKKPLTKEDEIKEWLDDEKGVKQMLEPFAAYAAFVKPYAEGKLSAYTSCFEIIVHDRRVALLGFNSALMCGRLKDDYGKIIIGEPQIYDILQNTENADLRLAIMHHPFNWLTEIDRGTVQRSLKQDAQFILCGHQHMNRVTAEKGTEGDCVVIPAGAAYDRRKASDPLYTNAYNFVHFDFEKNGGVVYLRCWNEKKGKWREDIDVYEGGNFEFFLPGESKTGETGETKIPSGISLNPAPAKYALNNPAFNVPFRAKKEGMVGREKAMRQVHGQLNDGKRTAIGHTAAFQGLGGLGKTQLAVEYAHRYRDEYPGGVIWINADVEIDPQLIAVAKQARWIAPESEHSVILEVAKRRLKTRSDCLIIFDNVIKVEDIEPYLPEVEAAPHLLLTSRKSQPGFTPIGIDVLDEALSLDLLLKESGRSLDNLPGEEKKAAVEIVRFMGGLPLAVEIAGAYLQHIPDLTFQNYFAVLNTNLKEAMKGDFLASFTRHEEENFFATLRVSQEVLDETEFFEDILDLLAWSGNSFMGISLMAAILEKKVADLYLPLKLGVTLRILQKSEEGERYDIHQLVRRVRQEQVPISGKTGWAEDVCLRLGDWFEERRYEFTDLPVFEAEIDHLEEWQQHAESCSGNQAARLTWLQAYPPFHWGIYRETHRLVKSALALLEKSRDPDQKIKANIFNDLGFTYDVLGKFSQALECGKKALDIRREELGEQHRDTAVSFNNVGSFYMNIGKYDEAFKYKKRALEIQLKLFDEQHPETALYIYNIGDYYSIIGNYKEALIYHKRALKIREKLFSDQHPDTAASFNSVGSIYGNLGDPQKGLQYHKRALKIHKNLFGDEHPNTAATLNNMTFSQNDLSEQRKSLEKALQITIKLFGDQHPNAAAAFTNVGVIYKELGYYKRGLEYHARALKIYLQLFGGPHPNTAAVYNNIGSTYNESGNKKEALKNYKKALKILMQFFSDQHPHVATSLHNIGGVYYDLACYKEAADCLERAFRIRCEFLGMKHLRTSDSLISVFRSLIKLKRSKEAIARLEDYLAKLPADHPKYQELFDLQKQIPKEKIRPKRTFPSKKKKKKKKGR
ncbi:MAG: tetratricopeptide repeat protein [Candidatus Aminicenantes bacterium]|nr:tetratricopeptide repeat protein [Candidatus Aminicenantes bacterium]